jgi:hypothetical protein
MVDDEGHHAETGGVAHPEVALDAGIERDAVLVAAAGDVLDQVEAEMPPQIDGDLR